MADTHDMIVIGAGWHGLAAAKAYIQLHPGEDILVLEAEDSIGGTWSRDRLYPGLKSNNLHGTYEHPDFPMSPEVYGLQAGREHIPGTTLHRYLTDFAKHFGIYERTRFNTTVDRLEPLTGKASGWSVGVTTDGVAAVLRARKVIVATGLTSQPNFPQYRGAETFGAPYFHAKDFCRNGDTVQPGQNVVVVGGAKSAMDVAYAYVAGGSHVDLVIRPEGNGPVWISQPWVMGGKRLEKLLSVRWMTWFSPCPWGGTDGSGWIRHLLHGTWLGRWLVDQFWGGLGGEVLQTNGYASHPELQKLQPWHSAFWTGSGLSIHNYDSNFFDLVKTGHISVHLANVDHLSPRAVHLDDAAATTLRADLLVCATGWRKEPSIQFVNFGPAGIGLPEPRAEQLRLSSAADEQILRTYPRLRAQPSLRFKPKANDPFRLYRFIVPPARLADRNIAFAGLVSSVSTAWAANIQGLWISAYLDGRLDIEARTPRAVAAEVMLHTQWGRWRYPCGYGASLPDFVFDALPYMDLLMRDLGLPVHRKQGWLADLTEPYGPEDYRGLVQEWLDAHGKK